MKKKAGLSIANRIAVLFPLLIRSHAIHETQDSAVQLGQEARNWSGARLAAIFSILFYL